MYRGLLGETLVHSYSKEIHECFENYEYHLISIKPEQINDFLEKKMFDYVNVTIPYKEKVIPYIDYLSDDVKRINAVNLIVNINNKLYGYNTDYLALKQIIIDKGYEIANKNILILGSGGTCKMAKTLCLDMNARSVYIASRKNNPEYLSYSDIYNDNYKFDVIINATPVGMYPNMEGSLINFEKLKTVKVVIDFIYNPYRTNLILDSQEKGIKYTNGLDILIYQAIYSYLIYKDLHHESSELYKSLNCKSTNEIVKIFFTKSKEILLKKQNIILIGMPFSGKTTIGKKLIKVFPDKIFEDTDENIESKYGSIENIFSENGERYFRKLESLEVERLSLKENQIISTGGGVVLSNENIKKLKRKGIILFLDKDLSNLALESGRPLVKTYDDLKSLYKSRYDKYLQACDGIVRIEKDDNFNKIINKCIETIKKVYERM